MRNVALLSKEDREVLFSRTAEKMKMHPSIVEKDFNLKKSKNYKIIMDSFSFIKNYISSLKKD